jgi:hypothetical protein
MSHKENSGVRSFLRSPIGMVLIGFLAVAAFLLIAEHRAHVFTGNWFLGALLLACVGMHFFHSHGGHGGESDGHGHDKPEAKRRDGEQP